MASNQMSRRDNTTEEKEGRLPEKERVPKMASHFEHLAEKVAESNPLAHSHHGGEGGHFESLSDKVKGIDIKDKQPGEAVSVAKVEVVVTGAGPGQGQHEQQSGGYGQGTRLYHGGQDQHFVVRGHGAPTDQHDLGMSRLAKDTLSHGGQGQQFGRQGQSAKDTMSYGAQGQNLGVQGQSTMSHGAQGQGHHQLGSHGQAPTMSLGGQAQGQQAKGTLTHGAQGQQFGGQARAQGQGQQISSHGHTLPYRAQESMSHGGQAHQQGQGQQFGGHAKDTMSRGAQGEGQQFSSHGHSAMSTLPHRAQGQQQGQGHHQQGQGQQYGGQAKEAISHGGQAKDSISHGAQGHQHGGQAKDTISHGIQGQGARSGQERGEQQKHVQETGKHGPTQQDIMPALIAAEDRYAQSKQSQSQGQERDINKSNQDRETTSQKTGVSERGDRAKQSQELRHGVGTEHDQQRLTEEEEEEEDMEDAMEEMEMEAEEGFALRDTVVNTAQKTKETVLTAAEKAREVSVPAAKTAAEYAGKAASATKNTAVVAGWSTAQLTATAAVEGTKLAAKAVQGVAGYVAPVVTSVGQKGAEIAAKSFDSAMNAAVSTGETAKEYAARKKEEARRDAEVKRSGQFEGESCQESEMRPGFTEEKPQSKMGFSHNEQLKAQQGTESLGLRNRRGQGGSEWEAQRGGKDSGPLFQQGAPGVQASSEWEAQRGRKDSDSGGLFQQRTPGVQAGSEWEAQRGRKDSDSGGLFQQRAPEVQGGSEWEAQRGRRDYDSGGLFQQGDRGSFEDRNREVYEPTAEEQTEEITGGVLHAIGETIAEIAHTTKELMIGHDQPHEAERFGSKDVTAEGFGTKTGDAREQYAKTVEDRRNLGGSGI